MDEMLAGEWNRYNIEYSINRSGSGTTFAGVIPGRVIETGGTRRVEIPFSHNFTDEEDAITETRVLRRVVPNPDKPIVLYAKMCHMSSL